MRLRTLGLLLGISCNGGRANTSDPVDTGRGGDSRFSCEQQTVQAYDGANIYEIDFSGELVDDETMQGTAVVSFQLDEESESLIADAGFDMSDCDHSIDLELAYGRF